MLQFVGDNEDAIHFAIDCVSHNVAEYLMSDHARDKSLDSVKESTAAAIDAYISATPAMMMMEGRSRGMSSSLSRRARSLSSRQQRQI